MSYPEQIEQDSRPDDFGGVETFDCLCPFGTNANGDGVIETRVMLEDWVRFGDEVKVQNVIWVPAEGANDPAWDLREFLMDKKFGYRAYIELPPVEKWISVI